MPFRRLKQTGPQALLKPVSRVRINPSFIHRLCAVPTGPQPRCGPDRGPSKCPGFPTPWRGPGGRRQSWPTDLRRRSTSPTTCGTSATSRQARGAGHAPCANRRGSCRGRAGHHRQRSMVSATAMSNGIQACFSTATLDDDPPHPVAGLPKACSKAACFSSTPCAEWAPNVSFLAMGGCDDG
jgi:hypothetical protein